MSAPKEGDNVSWNYGAGKPSGKVEEVVEGDASIETKNGNTVTKKGSKDDPAVKIKQNGKNPVIKQAHELNETEGATSKAKQAEEDKEKPKSAGNKRKKADAEDEDKEESKKPASKGKKAPAKKAAKKADEPDAEEEEEKEEEAKKPASKGKPASKPKSRGAKKADADEEMKEAEPAKPASKKKQPAAKKGGKKAKKDEEEEEAEDDDEDLDDIPEDEIEQPLGKKQKTDDKPKGRSTRTSKKAEAEAE